MRVELVDDQNEDTIGICVDRLFDVGHEVLDAKSEEESRRALAPLAGKGLRAPKGPDIPAQGEALGGGTTSRSPEGALHEGATDVMAQSLSKILLHLVFSTKNRRPSIPQDLAAATQGFALG